MKDQKPAIAIIVFTIILLVGGVLLLSQNEKSSGQKQKIETAILIPKTSFQTSKKAKIQIVEFGDYECPACSFYHTEITKTLDKYGTKVNYVFRHFPLPQHENAREAAKAAEAAGVQGKFFEMHDALYNNQVEWTSSGNPKSNFIAYAKKLKLDTKKFEEDLNSGKFDKKINADISDGTKVSIQATPTYFINGELFEDNPTFENLKTKIGSLL